MIEMNSFEAVKTVLAVAFCSAVLIAAAPVAAALWLFKKAAAALR